MISIRVDLGNVRARLAQLAAVPQALQALMPVLGRELRNRLMTHYRGLERTAANKLGGRRQHFWRQVAQSVQAPVVAGNGKGVSVSVNHPAIAQKVYGGPIRAKRKAWLTIPVSKQAYGRTVETFGRETQIRLFLVKRSNGSRLLAAAAKSGGIEVHYVLKKEVNQAADPQAMPKDGKLEKAVSERTESWLARKFGSGRVGI